MAYLSLTISILSLVLSLSTAWLTLFRRGKLKMTKPTFIAFCYDIGKNGKPIPKIFIRALLYSTGKRGHVIENMYLVVHNESERTIFNVWGHGDEKLSRGSGMFVGETGVATNHHFNILPDALPFEYSNGSYKIQIFATLPGQKSSLHIHTVEIHVDKLLQSSMAQKPDAAIWFEWQPDLNNYHAHLETKPRALS